MEFLVTESNDQTRIAFTGALDVNTTPEVRSKLDAIVQARPRQVVVDLSGLVQIDSTGVGGLVSLFKRVREYGGKFLVENVRGQPLGIFEVLRLDRVFGLDTATK